jgi:hypothetical protein
MNGVSLHYKHDNRRQQGNPCLADLPDNELVSLCLENQRPAWEEFFRRYISLIKQAIKSKLRDHGYGQVSDDQDILWDIHGKIVEKLYGRGLLRQCVNIEGIRPWLKSVAQNQTTDWVIEQGRKKRLPQRQAESSTVSLSEPIKGTSGLTLGDMMSEHDESDDDLKVYVESVLDRIGKAGEDRKLWVLRLSIISQLPLTAEDIARLSRFSGHNESEVRSRIAFMMQQVEVKEEKRIAAMGKAILLWHEIRRLEARLINENRSSPDTAEAERIMLEIQGEMGQREKMLNDGKRLIRPANRDIAALVGLPENQAEQVSTILIRAREILRTTMEGQLPHDGM